ncbi:hypothetical protein CC1G_04792 [Coprinopsis cinerea okayama7|uniref:Uncharacterized protein n=1 Tax=Coprinopsis cinerea (strain Okayama-7 / 130 / ATCC MYA-4618 / FGSC 9003) TaxID=240176 RepID=A8P2K9_COPC7|nr:hypothetical protein CC1G_04792 [Coprinopsis cinerea okayama7\|eukprot:XP_001838348.2 hypothetical protein CC1G_04792 [Coprinopsis cinerea okayama7\
MKLVGNGYNSDSAGSTLLSSPTTACPPQGISSRLPTSSHSFIHRSLLVTRHRQYQPQQMMSFTRLVLSALLFISSALVPYVVGQQPSQAAGCYACPVTDNLLTPLVGIPDLSLDPFSCVYGAFSPGTCTYSRTTGDLVADSNSGRCQARALDVCFLRRRNALPRSPKPPSPAAYEPKPRAMHVRKDLAGNKRDARAKHDSDIREHDFE